MTILRTLWRRLFRIQGISSKAMPLRLKAGISFIFQKLLEIDICTGRRIRQLLSILLRPVHPSFQGRSFLRRIIVNLSLRIRISS